MKKLIKSAIAVIIIIILISVIHKSMINKEGYTNILIIGESISEEQKELVLEYLNINEEHTKEIILTKDDVTKYLGEDVASNDILSCAYIEPTTEGGIHVRTVNISDITADMIRNTIVTSGITNANIICVSPVKVSDNYCIAGILKAYDKGTEIKTDTDKISIANNELTQTINLSKTLGDKNTTELMSSLKEDIISNQFNKEEIKDRVEEYINSNNLELTDYQKDSLVQLMIDISGKDYSIDEVKGAYKAVKSTAEKVKSTTKKAKKGVNKIKGYLSMMWKKLGGVENEHTNILDNTNNNVFGPDVIITTTDYEVNNKEGIEEETDISIENTIEDNNTDTEIVEEIKENEEISIEEESSTDFENCNNLLDYLIYYLEHTEETTSDNNATMDNTFESLTN